MMIKKLFLNDRVILILIVLNAVLIFASGFNHSNKTEFYIVLFDNIITSLFVVELIIKLKEFGPRKYFDSNWNKFDFILILLSVPALITYVLNIEIATVSFLLALRVLRVFKSFRFIKFVPGIESLIRGIQRALKASIIVIIGFIIYIFIVGTFSFYIFKTSAPEYFGNPLTSMYSIFKLFTIEGWYEMPENITKTFTDTTSFFTYFYFIFILLTGGVFGLSLVNSIFVDAMLSDNTDEIENKIDNLDNKISKILTKIEENETRKNS